MLQITTHPKQNTRHLGPWPPQDDAPPSARPQNTHVGDIVTRPAPISWPFPSCLSQTAPILPHLWYSRCRTDRPIDPDRRISSALVTLLSSHHESRLSNPQTPSTDPLKPSISLRIKRGNGQIYTQRSSGRAKDLPKENFSKKKKRAAQSIGSRQAGHQERLTNYTKHLSFSYQVLAALASPPPPPQSFPRLIRFSKFEKRKNAASISTCLGILA